MSICRQKVGDKNFLIHAPKGATWASVNDVLSSWTNNNFNYPKSKSESDPGFRFAQLGAIFSIKSHWTVSSSTATTFVFDINRMSIQTQKYNPELMVSSEA